MEFIATTAIRTCTYALLAAGIVILYKAGRVVNFAHGEIAIVGGYVFYSSGLMGGGMSLWLAILGAVVFAVVVIGGMGSILGSILTGFTLGVVEGLPKVFYPEASNTVVFVIMAIVLIIRPSGLFGRVA